MTLEPSCPDCGEELSPCMGHTYGVVEWRCDECDEVRETEVVL